MHLAERYALGTSSKIGDPHILETHYPILEKNYITFHPFSKDSKNYSHWDEVLVLIAPVLEKAGIKIVQIGGRGERPFPFCVHTQGTTSYNDVAYIVRRSRLHLSTDSFAAHIAGHFNIPQVCLFSNNYPSCVGSFWGAKENKIFLEPDRPEGEKPNFVLSENPKSIDTIKPEKIAESVCKLLGLKFDYPYKSLAFGPFFEHPIIESLCNQVVDPKQFGSDSIFVRYDLEQNDEFLVAQLRTSKINLFTNRPVNPNILQGFAHQIVEIIYLIESTDKKSIETAKAFIGMAKALNIRVVLLSYLPKEEINKIKLDFIDFPPIIFKSSRRPDFLEKYVEKTGDKELANVYFKSKRFILSGGKTYLGTNCFKNDLTCGGFNDNVGKVEDKEDFWREAEHFYFLIKKI